MDYRHGRPVHGGLDVAELESLGLAVSDVLDFSVSVNPLGPSPVALEAAQSVNLGAYPDPDCVRLRNAIGREVGIEPDRILAGNGSTELIHLIARAFLGSGDTAAVFAPTFGEYAAACHLQGVAPTMLSSSDIGFRWDVPAALDTIAELRPALVFLCNPNNPTGVYLREKEVQAIAEALDGIGLLVLDEAYVSFVDGRWDSTQLLSMHNVVLLRSMTKDHALTGLRLGFMSADVIGRVRRYQYSWSVNALAQAAGIVAIADREHVERGREAVRLGKGYLMDTARSLGVECVPSAANFLMLRVRLAAELRLALLKGHGVCVRDCASFGLPEHIRIGVRTMDDNRRLSEALKQVLKK